MEIIYRKFLKGSELEFTFSLWPLIQDTTEQETRQTLKGHNSVKS